MPFSFATPPPYRARARVAQRDKNGVTDSLAPLPTFLSLPHSRTSHFWDGTSRPPWPPEVRDSVCQCRFGPNSRNGLAHSLLNYSCFGRCPCRSCQACLRLTLGSWPRGSYMNTLVPIIRIPNCTMRVLTLFVTAAALLAAGVVGQTNPAAVLAQIPACTVSPRCLGILFTYVLCSKNAASKCCCQHNAH